MAGFAAVDVDDLIRIIKPTLKKIQHTPSPIGAASLAPVGQSSPGDRMQYEFDLAGTPVLTANAPLSGRAVYFLPRGRSLAGVERVGNEGGGQC